MHTTGWSGGLEVTGGGQGARVGAGDGPARGTARGAAGGQDPTLNVRRGPAYPHA
jgi:hypothetical protein